MYEFKDLTPNSTASVLPSEAVFLDDSCLDTTLEGYQTLYVEGRESLEKEFQELKIDNVDGVSIYNSKLLQRTLTIGFKLSGKNSSEFTERFNKLKKLLISKDEFKIRFNDEPDVFYIGKLSKLENSKSHTCSQVATFEMLCPDPFKYSTTEKSFNLNTNKKFLIQNEGSVPVPIRYEFKFPSDCGYLGIASQYGAMEFGRRDELDYETTKGDQTLLKWSDFLNAPDRHDYPTGYDHNWDPARYHYPHSLKKISSGPNTPWGAGGDNSVKEYLELNRDDGAAHQGNWICGAFRMLNVPNDANNESGALDWTIYSFHWFEAGRMGECGEQEINIYTSDDKLIAHFGLFKIDSSGNTGQVSFSGPSGNYKLIPFETNWSGPFGSGNRGHNRITKKDDWVEFYYNGQNFRYHDPALKTMKAAKVLISVSDNLASSKQMAVNRITNVDFTKFNVSGKRDVVNTFGKNDVLVINGSDGKVYKKGMYRPELEVLGTKYFKVPSGDTEINVVPSSWFTGTIEGKAYIREAWL